MWSFSFRFLDGGQNAYSDYVAGCNAIHSCKPAEVRTVFESILPRTFIEWTVTPLERAVHAYAPMRFCCDIWYFFSEPHDRAVSAFFHPDEPAAQVMVCNSGMALLVQL